MPAAGRGRRGGCPCRPWGGDRVGAEGSGFRSPGTLGGYGSGVGVSWRDAAGVDSAPRLGDLRLSDGGVCSVRCKGLLLKAGS